MKIGLLIALAIATFSLCATQPDWNSYKHKALVFQKRIPGWCTLEKAEKMMELIHATEPEICVEIGVFGGSSIYPTAAALKYFKKGVVFAIDSWSTQDCLEGYTLEDPDFEWWGSVDLETIYLDFLAMLNTYQLTSFCNVMRLSSQQALAHFTDGSIDILHIDGNHSEAAAFADVQMYVPKLKQGGYLWFDDVNWISTGKALQCLMDPERFVFEKERSTDTCFLFRKI